MIDSIIESFNDDEVWSFITKITSGGFIIWCNVGDYETKLETDRYIECTETYGCNIDVFIYIKQIKVRYEVMKWSSNTLI